DQLRGSAAGESSISVAASAVVIGKLVHSWRNQTATEHRLMQSYNDCCRNATFPRRADKFEAGHPPLYLRVCLSRETPNLSAGAEYLDVEVADLLAERVAVDAQQIGGADLVATGRSEGCGEQRHLDLAQDAMIEARWRQAVREAGKVGRQIKLDRA